MIPENIACPLRILDCLGRLFLKFLFFFFVEEDPTIVSVSRGYMQQEWCLLPTNNFNNKTDTPVTNVDWLREKPRKCNA